MKTFSFGSRSQGNIDTMVDDLQLVFNESLKNSTVDFGISQGARSKEQQQQYFDEGKSKIDPSKYTDEKLVAIAKHVTTDGTPKSRAGDVFAYVKGKPSLAFDQRYLCFIGGVIIATSRMLYREGKISHLIRWGANWDKDGEIITDQSFQDLPHFEIYKP